MPRHMPAGFIDGRFHRRTYLPSCSTYGIGQVAGKTDLLLREAQTLRPQVQASTELLATGICKTITISCRPMSFFEITFLRNIGTCAPHCIALRYSLSVDWYFTSSLGT